MYIVSKIKLGVNLQMRFQNILVAYDGSENSIRAVEAAKTIATDHLAHVTVVYVSDHMVESTIYSYGGRYTQVEPDVIRSEPIDLEPNNQYDPNLRDEMIVGDDYSEQIMADAEIRLNVLPNVDYELLHGNATTEIKEYADRSNIDLVVIGNRGLSGLKKLFMGSVSVKK